MALSMTLNARTPSITTLGISVAYMKRQNHLNVNNQTKLNEISITTQNITTRP